MIMVDASDGTGQGSSRRKWLWVGIAAAIVVVAAIIAFAVTSGSGDDAKPSPSPTSSTSSSATPSATPSEEPGEADPSADPGAQPTPDPSATSETMPELPPVAPDEPADNRAGLVAEISAMKAVDGEAVQAGEIGGPAVQFTLTLTNDTDAPVDLGLIAVNAYIGEERTPAGGLVKPGAAPFEGTLDVGDSTEGVYVYTIPEDQRDDVTLTVDYRAGEPAFVFRGRVG
jgi:hypothetical protein